MKKCFLASCLRLSAWTHVPEQFIRFAIIGTINTAFAYILYVLFIFVDMHYTLAVLLSTIIGICFSFKTLGSWVFDNPDNRLIFKFFVVYIGCYFLNISIIGFFNRYIWNNLYVAGLISTLLVALVSFSLNRAIVFKK